MKLTGTPRIRRTVLVLLLLVFAATYEASVRYFFVQEQEPTVVVAGDTVAGAYAKDVLDTIEVKGRAPYTDYKRSQFGNGWANIANCDVRNIILARDLVFPEIAEDGCRVLSGQLDDPYTGRKILFVRGEQTSDDVQIDHVVALADGWQKGAQQLDYSRRIEFANDPLNLLAVDGPTNVKKGSSDAATWLPPNKMYRCRYVARQVAVKSTYKLWMTAAEKDAIERVLRTCPEQRLPLQGSAR